MYYLIIIGLVCLVNSWSKNEPNKDDKYERQS